MLQALEEFLNAHGGGFASPMYLDAKEKKYIDEIGAANFFAIKNNTYITPKSRSILPSITNMSIMSLAESMELKVERRQILLDELPTFDEVGACGTAAVISPISQIVDFEMNKTYNFCKDGKPGPISKNFMIRLQVYNSVRKEDKFGWIEIID